MGCSCQDEGTQAVNAITNTTALDSTDFDTVFDAASVRDDRRTSLTRSAQGLAAEISRIETDEDKLSVLMGLGALVAEVAALAAVDA